MKFKQICVAQYRSPGKDALGYSIIALAEDGTIWRGDSLTKGWLPFNMDTTDEQQYYKKRKKRTTAVESDF